MSGPADWRDAACRRSKPDEFFPDVGRKSDARRAVQVCRATPCPRLDECLEWSLATRERWGVWGGLTEVQRLRLLAAMDKREGLA